MTGGAIYNEIDDYPAEWIENLVALGVVAEGVVDRRSIEDLCAYDLRSSAGWLQHASGDGRLERGSEPSRWTEPSRWSTASGCGVDNLGDTECFERKRGRTGEAFPEPGTLERTERSGSADWVDHHHHQGLEGQRNGHRAETGQRQGSLRPVVEASGAEWVADTDVKHVYRAGLGSSNECRQCGRSEILRGELDSFGLADCDDDEWRADVPLGESERRAVDGRRGATLRMADGDLCGCKPQPHTERAGLQFKADGARSTWQQSRHDSSGLGIREPGPTNGPWRDADWLFCRDGKWRPVESGTFPLVDGSAFRLGSGSTFEGKSRQGMLKGYGNAVDAEATRAFIEDCIAFFSELAARRVSMEDLL